MFKFAFGISVQSFLVLLFDHNVDAIALGLLLSIVLIGLYRVSFRLMFRQTMRRIRRQFQPIANAVRPLKIIENTKLRTE